MTCILRLCNSTMTQIAMVNHIVCILFLITFTTATLRTKQMSFCGRILLHRYYASNIRNIRQNQFFDKMRVVCTDLFLSHILCHMWQKHNMFQFYVQERRKLPKAGWANSKVLSLLEACLDLILGSSLQMKIQIMDGKITENVGFKSLLRKVKKFLSFFSFSFSNCPKNCISLILTIFEFIV